MIENDRRSEPSCANEACPRPAESGEAYCGACGLERSLYRRDSRYTGPAESGGKPDGAGRAIKSTPAP